MPVPLIAPAIGLGAKTLAAMGGAYAATPMVSQLLSEIPGVLSKIPGTLNSFRPSQQVGTKLAQRNQGATNTSTQASTPQPQSGKPATADVDFVDPATITPSTPTPYQQITGTAPASKPASSKPKSAPKKQAQQAPAATTTPPKSVGNPDWHDAGNSMQAQNYVNAMPVQRSAGMSPDTSYDEATAISNAVQAEIDAANQAAFDNKYNQLLAMYGVAPGSGAPKVNQDAAMQYYGDQAVYDALARAYAGAPVFNAWG